MSVYSISIDLSLDEVLRRILEYDNLIDEIREKNEEKKLNPTSDEYKENELRIRFINEAKRRLLENFRIAQQSIEQ